MEINRKNLKKVLYAIRFNNFEILNTFVFIMLMDCTRYAMLYITHIYYFVSHLIVSLVIHDYVHMSVCQPRK